MDARVALLKQLTVSGVMEAVMALSFFISAGRTDIFRSWLFFLFTALYFLSTTYALYLLNPELLVVRLSIKRDGSKAWDELLMRLNNLTLLLAVPAAAGVDVGRFMWTNLDWTYAIVGYMLFVTAGVLITWSMAVNRHFEPTVRIQDDRDHKVISTGPYRMVRHPGYLAGILWAWSMPLTLGSMLAFIPVAVYTGLMIIRTYLEDRTLMEELVGYTEYAERVNYRLFPLLW